MKNPENEYIQVKESAVHNKGVFAAKNIPAKTKIIEYVGEIISKEEGTRRSKITEDDYVANPKTAAGTYIFELDDERDLDGNVPENPARYINHSCEPNCDIEIIGDHIWVIALKDIAAGTELNYNYGYDFDEEDYAKHPCCCGSKNCVGFIVDPTDWGKLPRSKS